MQPDNSTDRDDGEVVDSVADTAGDVNQHDDDELYVDEGTNYADDEGTDYADEDEDKDWDDDNLLYASLSWPFNDSREQPTPGNDDKSRLNGGTLNHIRFRGSPVRA